MNTKKLMMIGVVLVVGYFVYDKFFKKPKTDSPVG